MTSVWAELKRRNVVRVAIAYAVVGWLLIEVASTVFPIVQLPAWTVTFVTMLLIMGFPVAVILSWAYEIRPDRTRSAARTTVAEPVTDIRKRSFNIAIIAALVLALGIVVLDNYVLVGDDADSGVLPNSIAVLPFENLSLDPDNAFFAAGIHDTILNELAKITDMNVIARTSVLQYANGQTPIARIADDLNVETVMEGTVQYDSANGQVRITAQLINPETGAHLWAGNYDRAFSDIFAIQSEIASQISMALEAELLPAELESIDRIPTRSPQAYELYLKALALVPNIAPISPAEYFVALNQAIVLDPAFAPAHATLAFAYGRAFMYSDSEELAGSIEAHEALVRDHAQAALRADPGQGLAHAALGLVESAHHRLGNAEAHWARAVDTSPNDVEVLDDAAIFYAYVDRMDEANRLLARIRQLDPAVEGARRITTA